MRRTSCAISTNNIVDPYVSHHAQEAEPSRHTDQSLESMPEIDQEFNPDPPPYNPRLPSSLYQLKSLLEDGFAQELPLSDLSVGKQGVEPL